MERPFSEGLRSYPYEEWLANKSQPNNKKDSYKPDTSTIQRDFDLTSPSAATTTNSTTSLLKPNTSIYDAMSNIKKNSSNITNTENPSTEEVRKMDKLNVVNCLHRGAFEGTKGKRWLIAIDGTESSHHAFESAIKLIDIEKDHVFLVTGNVRSLHKYRFNSLFSKRKKHSYRILFFKELNYPSTQSMASCI